jgi:mRNA interferase MazF
VKRGEVYDARLDPTEGSEQAGARPVVIVSRDAINEASPVILAVPCTRLRRGRGVYPSQAVLPAPEGGLDADSLVLCEQVRALGTSRLGRCRGVLSAPSISTIDRALLIALDLLDKP